MRKFSALVFAALLATTATPAVAQETIKVSAPQRGAWDTSVPELGQRAGIFKKHGLNLEILYTSGGAESQQGVISGSLDFAVAVGIASVLSAYSKGGPVRIIGSEMIGSPDLYWYVPAASPLKSFKDAGGKTVGYSVTGSSSHAALLRLLQQAGVTAKPIATGGMPATLTQTMTSQIDIGWAAAPFGLGDIADGKVRIIGRGLDVDSLRGQTVRVNITNTDMLTKRKEVVARFMQAYRETVDWMYSDPNALKVYEEFSKVPETLMREGRDRFFPKETMLPDKIMGLDEVLDEALKLKFIQQQMTKEQIAELVQIPAPVK